MFKRGVSPLIATVLLVGFTVAIAGVFITWGSGFVKDIQSSTQEASKEKVTCSTNVGVKIKNACIEGSDVKLLIENFGSVDMIKFDVRTIGSLSASNVQTSSGLNAYDIQTFNVALDPSIGVLESVEVFPVVNLAGEDVSCANNFDRRRGIENCVAATGCTFPQISCNSVCTTPVCFNDGNCAAGQTCQNPGTCSAQCVSGGCTPPQILCNSVCRTPACSSNANCAAGQTCQNPGTCSAQCVSAGGDTIAPTVSIIIPSSGTTVSPSQQVQANAIDNVAVANVQFKLDGNNLGSLDTTSPYSITWDTTLTSNGQHTLTAVATDTSGNTATSAGVTVTVTGTSNVFPIYKEAESGQIISTFTVVNDAGASNGKYIDTPTGTPGTSSPTTEVSVPIDIPTTGTYYLWARIYGPSASEDAIYVGFDGSFDRIFPSSFGNWEWIKVEATPGNFAFNLNAGNHAITIGHGEPRARIDVLALTNDPNFVPSGIP